MRLRAFTWRESNNREAFRELSHETEPAFCSLTKRSASIGKISWLSAPHRLIALVCRAASQRMPKPNHPATENRLLGSNRSAPMI